MVREEQWGLGHESGSPSIAVLPKPSRPRPYPPTSTPYHGMPFLSVWFVLFALAGMAEQAKIVTDRALEAVFDAFDVGGTGVLSPEAVQQVMTG